MCVCVSNEESDMLEILLGTSCYGNRVGRLARVGGVTTATSLGGQVMLKGRLWRSRHKNMSLQV